MSLTTDTLFVGCTRPTLVGGVTYPAIIANAMITSIVFLGSNNFLYILICLPIHAIAYLVCATEPRAFELLNLWSKTKGRNLNRRIWGCSSYCQFEEFRPKKATKEKA